MGALDTAVRAGQGAVRRHLLLLGRAHRGGGADPARAGHAAAHPPAVLLAAQPLDRGGPARRARARRASAASCSRRSPRACSPTATSTASPRTRARRPAASLSEDMLTDGALDHVRALNEIARERGQTLAQMAIAWTLRDPRVTSSLIGASSVAQLEDSLGALDNLDFTDDELRGDRPARRRCRHQPVEGVERRLTAPRSPRPSWSAGREHCSRRPGWSPRRRRPWPRRSCGRACAASTRTASPACRCTPSGCAPACSTAARGRRSPPATARSRSSTATAVPARSPRSFATDLSIELAREHGVGVVGVRRSGHYGAAAFYAMRAAEPGCSASR